MKFNKPSYGHKSYNSAYNGILNYIQDNHQDVIPKTKDVNQYFSKVNKLIRKFLKSKNLKVKDNGSSNSAHFNANVIQENWKEFKQYLEEI
ncbi:hypothetical protein [Polaribacter sp.]|uniref:hypothetical protein n=1 Tax=Polaribacter sp. TaxID=1920175 RepID=UPI003F6B592F